MVIRRHWISFFSQRLRHNSREKSWGRAIYTLISQKQSVRWSKKPPQRSLGWVGGEVTNKSWLQITMPAIEIWEEKGILGYENHTRGLVLLMQMSLNVSFIGPECRSHPGNTQSNLEERERKKKWASQKWFFQLFSFSFSISYLQILSSGWNADRMLQHKFGVKMLKSWEVLCRRPKVCILKKKWKQSRNNGDSWKEANVRWMERKWAKPQEVINEKTINFKESQWLQSLLSLGVIPEAHPHPVV